MDIHRQASGPVVMRDGLSSKAFCTLFPSQFSLEFNGRPNGNICLTAVLKFNTQKPAFADPIAKPNLPEKVSAKAMVTDESAIEHRLRRGPFILNVENLILPVTLSIPLMMRIYLNKTSLEKTADRKFKIGTVKLTVAIFLWTSLERSQLLFRNLISGGNDWFLCVRTRGT